MNRREVIAGLLLPLLASRARAEPGPKVYRIEILVGAARLEDITQTGFSTWRAFFEELRALGYVEGSNIRVGRSTGEGKVERYAEIARAAVDRHPDVILTTATAIAIALKEATSSIPVVMAVADPVSVGALVSSLARPGGNMTGVSVDAGMEIYGKYLEILRSIDPKATKVGFLAQRSIWELPIGRAMLDTAARAGVSLLGPPLESPIDEAAYRRVIAAFVENGAQGVIVHPASESYVYRRLVADLLTASKLPAVHAFIEGARAGGLVAYAVDLDDLFRVVARYVDRILKGANPAEMPIYQPTKWKLVVNLKAAKAIGVELPASLVLRADEVIE